MNNQKEIWKDIKGYEGIYKISNLGRVKSKRKINYGYKSSNGYKKTTLSKNNIQTDFYIHRLVGIHFILNLDNKPQINHKNGIKTDNSIENLEWVTCQENAIPAYNNGLSKPITPKGENHHKSKLSIINVLEIKEMLKNGYTQNIIANKFGVKKGAISHIKNGRNWKSTILI